MRFAGRLTQAALLLLLLFPVAGRAQALRDPEAVPLGADRAVDFDCDGISDPVVASADRQAVILRLSRSARPTRLELAYRISGLAPIDVDRDGYPDLVVLAHAEAPAALQEQQVLVLRNQACGQFTVSHGLPLNDRFTGSQHEQAGTPRPPLLPTTSSSLRALDIMLGEPVRVPDAAPYAEPFGPWQSRAPPFFTPPSLTLSV